MEHETDDRVRLDKWLWAARFYKTRALAAEAIDGGKVDVNDARVKRAKIVQVGDEVRIRQTPFEHVVIVRGVSERRGPGVRRRDALRGDRREQGEARGAGDADPQHAARRLGQRAADEARPARDRALSAPLTGGRGLTRVRRGARSDAAASCVERRVVQAMPALELRRVVRQSPQPRSARSCASAAAHGASSSRVPADEHDGAAAETRRERGEVDVGRKRASPENDFVRAHAPARSQRATVATPCENPSTRSLTPRAVRGGRTRSCSASRYAT